MIQPNTPHIEGDAKTRCSQSTWIYLLWPLSFLFIKFYLHLTNSSDLCKLPAKDEYIIEPIESLSLDLTTAVALRHELTSQCEIRRFKSVEHGCCHCCDVLFHSACSSLVIFERRLRVMRDHDLRVAVVLGRAYGALVRAALRNVNDALGHLRLWWRVLLARTRAAWLVRLARREEKF